MNKKKTLTGFTLIEILVVSTIIGLLMAGGIASYSHFGKQSRDARRKADLEQVRAALEMYRSNSTLSSYPTSLSALVSNYIKSEPVDPKTQESYSYSPLSSGANCAAEPCDSYLLSTALEATGGTYETDPYGGSLITNTPVPVTNTPAPTDLPPPDCQCDDWFVTGDNCTPPQVATCTGKYTCECQYPAVTSTPTPTPIMPTATPTPPTCIAAGGICCAFYCCSALPYTDCDKYSTCCVPGQCVGLPEQCSI